MQNKESKKEKILQDIDEDEIKEIPEDILEKLILDEMFRRSIELKKKKSKVQQ